MIRLGVGQRNKSYQGRQRQSNFLKIHSIVSCCSIVNLASAFRFLRAFPLRQMLARLEAHCKNGYERLHRNTALELSEPGLIPCEKLQYTLPLAIHELSRVASPGVRVSLMHSTLALAVPASVRLSSWPQSKCRSRSLLMASSLISEIRTLNSSRSDSTSPSDAAIIRPIFALRSCGFCRCFFAQQKFVLTPQCKLPVRLDQRDSPGWRQRRYLD